MIIKKITIYVEICGEIFSEETEIIVENLEEINEKADEKSEKFKNYLIEYEMSYGWEFRD